MTTLAGKRADIYVSSGASVSMPLEAMSDISANYPANPATLARTIYQVTAQAKRYYDTSSVLTFDISLNSGGAWNPVVPDFQDAGLIRFTAQQQAAPAAMFRVNTGKYLPYSRMGGGHEWGSGPVIALLDVTEFGQTSKHHIVGQTSGTITLKRWWLDDTMRAVLGNLLVLVLYVDATAQPAAPRYEMLARLKTDSIKVAAAQAITEDLTFEIQSAVTFLSA
jgi:hypothetical protein